MPMRRSRHSIESEPPVVNAMRGMLPSAWVRGSLSVLSVVAVLTQLVTVGIVTWRRHLPTWITSGMFDPPGTPVRVNFPLTSVRALVMGLPDAVAVHWSHDAPVGTGSSAALGM